MTLEWWVVVLFVLNVLLLLLNLLVGFLVSSGVAGLIRSATTQKDSMQTLSEQMTELEEKQAEMHRDVRQTAQHFVNFAKGVRGSQDRPWYSQF